VLGAFAFSVLLSIVAGVIPAFSAARLAPTEALRRT
jgi:ABC-type antimicrobial peptide transport system permease subunit